MISTVTTSTVSIVSIDAFTASLAFIGILILLVLVIQKELAMVTSSVRSQKLNKSLNIGIIPLLIAIIMIVSFKVLDVLR